MCFENAKKKLGFGFMRLPSNEGEIDYGELDKMVDCFIEEGFNYFDTAHGYMGQRSETALRESLTKRYPRGSYVLADKLTDFFFNKEEDIRPFFERQLADCGVDYFDIYLMHAQNKDRFAYFKKHRAYETAFELKKEGKIKHVGISFHDTADVLEDILTEYPQIEAVQLQLNYVDYDDAAVQSGKCYEVCCKHGKPVIVMEPVKGGSLANLPQEAQKIFDGLNGGSSASYAIRFAASLPNVAMVLSGMSNLKQVKDNVSYMKNFAPLNEREKQAVAQVRGFFGKMNLIPCTACRYCTDGCPKRISIPDLFACMNALNTYRNWNANYYYDEVYTKNGGKASACIKCGKCEKACPQHLEIRSLLEKVAKEFEK
ncbi:MAG: aldo/keto reductase [Corallococcus sp.]|nr:aldo/keto reductase [Bacillota bacterium]MCM1533385.1 aldo/keto reductase [Corallococcus sp.]